MISIICTLIASAAIVTCVLTLCFKGITFHKKMEVLPTRTPPIPVERPPELDHIEHLLNEGERIRKENETPTPAPTGTATGNTSAMDKVLKTIQEVFGPELPPDEGGIR